MDHEDLYMLYYFQEDYSPEKVVPKPVYCNFCKNTIIVQLIRHAIPYWEDDDPSSDNVPRVTSFYVEDIKVLPPNIDAGYGADIHHDVRNDTEIRNNKDLRIICKTKMNLNYCYMAYDEQDQRLLRPIYNTQRKKCYWLKDSETSFDVGSLVTFNVLRYPDDNDDHPTPYPHAYEDTVVERDARPVSSGNSSTWNFGSLEVIAKQHIHEIFPKELLQMKNDKFYVIEKSVCPSVGILLAEEDNMSHLNGRLYVVDGNTRLNFLITALTFDKPKRHGSRKCLVILGLGRPFSGSGGRFNPARCYVLVIGIKFIP